MGASVAAMAAAAAMFAAFVDVVVIVVAMTSVMDAMKGCMMSANAAVESLIAGFASSSESFAPG